MELNVNHKAVIAKTIMATHSIVSVMNNRMQVEMFANELIRRLQAQCINRMMEIDGAFLEHEIVEPSAETEEQTQKEEEIAVEKTEPN